MQDVSIYLQPGVYVDSDHPDIISYVDRVLTERGALSDLQKAIALFEAVREDIRYNPYSLSFTADNYRASNVLHSGANFCVPKAILLTAVLRAAGIPAAAGFADVRNHLNSPKLAALMESDIFIFHGYSKLWIDGKSFKVTPAFNGELCSRFGVKPLEFDGTGDALFHEFDTAGRQHMEYVRDRGIFTDPPVPDILEELDQTYPKFRQAAEAAAGDSAFA